MDDGSTARIGSEHFLAAVSTARRALDREAHPSVDVLDTVVSAGLELAFAIDAVPLTQEADADPCLAAGASAIRALAALAADATRSEKPWCAQALLRIAMRIAAGDPHAAYLEH